MNYRVVCTRLINDEYEEIRNQQSENVIFLFHNQHTDTRYYNPAIAEHISKHTYHITLNTMGQGHLNSNTIGIRHFNMGTPDNEL